MILTPITKRTCYRYMDGVSVLKVRSLSCSTIRKTLIAEVNYRHRFREYFAQTQSDSHAYLRMSLKYSCLDDRLKISFTIGDPFHQNINRNTIFYQEYTNTNRFDNHSRYIGLRATWSFGGKQVHRTYHDNRDTESQRAK